MILNKTYDEILDSMRTAYFNECGCVVEENSQTHKRFEILASELYSLSCLNDYIFKQAFIQSATGECLDMHGQVRGCVRKTPAKASGELRFIIDEASENDISIPKNTICSVKGKPYLQFTTTEDAVLPAGESDVTVKAQALESGAMYNVKAGVITQLVNAPISVSRVVNDYEFMGGYNEESDDSYRERILKHYFFDQNDINAVSFENRVLALDYVTDCRIAPMWDMMGMTIYVTTKSGTLTMDEMYEISRQIPILAAAGISYQIMLAQRDGFSLMVNLGVKSGYDKQSIVSEIEDKIKNRLAGIKIGYLIFVDELRAIVNSIDGVDYCDFQSNKIADGAICPDEGKVLAVDDIGVNFIYE